MRQIAFLQSAKIYRAIASSLQSRSNLFPHPFNTFARMTPQELIAYFETTTLPDTLRLDRASTQLDVAEAVKRNIETMLLNTDNGRAKHRLTQIKNALESPYDGPGIPKL